MSYRERMAERRKLRLEQWESDYEEYWRRMTGDSLTGKQHITRLYKINIERLPEWQQRVIRKLRMLLA